jgi:hypothetical protein
MSFTSIPNQPIVFNADVATNCPGCNGDYKQLIDYSDQIFFQLAAQPCTNKLPLTLPTNTEWERTKNIVCSTEAAVGGNASITFTMTKPYSVFKVVVVIQTLTEGELVLTIQGGNSYVFYTAGTYELYLATNEAVLGDLSLQLFFASNTYVGCFSLDCEVYGIETDVQVAWVDADSLEFIAEADYLTTVIDNKVTVAMDMTNNEVGSGCYRLAITDNCDPCIIDGLCNQALQTEGGCWTADGEDNWQLFPNGQATIEGDGLTPAAYAFVNSTELCVGAEYTISYTLTACEGGNTFRLQGFTGSAIRTEAGVYTETLIASSTNLAFRAGIVGSGLVAVESLSVKRTASSLDYTQFSDILSVGEYNDDCKYFRIEGCNAEDQFGLAFGGSSFLPGVRLEGRKFRAQYITEVNNFRFASGKWATTYVDREKKWTFAFGRLPEYILDFLSTIFYYDNCYVNGDLYYSIEGEFPDIDYNDADNLGNLAIDLALKSSKVRKTLCSNTDANCLPSILDNGDEPFILSQDGQRLTTEDSVNLYFEYNS